ncbi:hypothetical protein ECH_1099 [Ehrlichia chaffeensis str. Arkansas]|uniref:Uncharacterized protein n=1 Tax=Ehrlichia chaffeensis (strain ATCC CRL-10679 / Arkansas) TaxID=205920 RepID=Q2GFA0_EHRCR|nr:hypothetical protein ECH_1099 [Ehrlichia chaffeensis str. Arkansas]
MLLPTILKFIYLLQHVYSVSSNSVFFTSIVTSTT